MDRSQLNYQVHTFGCKVNTYDTGLIQKNLNTHEFKFKDSFVKEIETPTHIHVLNTCAVTANATKEAVKYIRKLKVKDPFSLIVVTGCAAQVDTGSFSELPGVDLVVANSHKSLLPDLIKKHYTGELKDKVFKSNIFRKEDLEIGGGSEKNHTRSFLKIQDGCNSFCSYCIIPYARGKSRSISKKVLAQRINELYSEGVREVVLTGVHIGDYEDPEDVNSHLEELLEYLIQKTKMPRFRLSSLEPVEVTEKLLSMYHNNSRLVPHFHMSIQSAETQVLKDMKRNYTQAEVIQSLNRIKELLPHAYIGMDVIVGFPTETEEKFIETMECLRKTPWTKIHVFPYSERQGTRAAIITEKVEWAERLKRASMMRELSLSRVRSEGIKEIGQIRNVLVLKKPSKGSHGVTENYWNCVIEGAEEYLNSWAGQEVKVRIKDYQFKNNETDEGYLIGEVVVEEN